MAMRRALEAEPKFANRTIRWQLTRDNPLPYVSDRTGQGDVRAAAAVREAITKSGGSLINVLLADLLVEKRKGQSGGATQVKVTIPGSTSEAGITRRELVGPWRKAKWQQMIR